jgi:hypothetical protein
MQPSVITVCALISAAWVLGAIGCWRIGDVEPLRRRYFLSGLILKLVTAGFGLFTAATLMCYWLDQYTGLDVAPVSWVNRLWLTASAASALIAWAAIHRLGRVMLRLGHGWAATQLFVLSVLVWASAFLAYSVAVAESRLALPEVLFACWPNAGTGHVTVSAFIAGDDLRRLTFGPTGRFDDFETYVLLLLPLFHVWLLATLIHALLVLKRAVASADGRSDASCRP